MKINVLLAEDELSLGKIIADSLINNGFEVTHCVDGQEALDKYITIAPDILVLDIMMPKIDGYSVAKTIRKEHKTIPILFLTAKSQTQDVVKGFHAGGNDYLKKPFSMEELIVRIEALVKRNVQTVSNNAEQINIGFFSFSPQKQILKTTDISYNLTSREAELLHHLYLNKNAILDRSYILNKLWGNDDFFNARSMDVFISKLRKKLKHDTQIQIINVRGYGYKLIC